MPLEPGTKLGPYAILAPLGAGGMGEVYRARDERLSRDVAVKVLPRSFAADPERLRRFEQEARSTGQLNHPNILVVYDTGTHDGLPYVVEELLEGATLRERMSGGPLPARKSIDYAIQIAHGLAAAHQKGIVHRDLKPENLFVTTDGRVKILDFGLAKLVASRGGGPSLTEAPTQVETGSGVVLGTVGYMSPEQVRGQTADHRSDLFSFGSILYEMIAGRRAFQSGSSVETMNAILKEDPPDITRAGEMPPGLDRIVLHCLEKSPDERFQSARDLAFQLEALSAPVVPSSVGPAPARAAAAPSPARSLGRPLVVAAMALGMFALGIVADRLMRPAPGSASFTQLTFRKGTLTTARFTPAGQSVVYAAAWEGGPLELYTTRPGSPESTPLGIPRAEILSVSSTGELAVLQDPKFIVGFERAGVLARAPLAGGVPRQILDDVQDADWSVDGQGLAVVHIVDGRYRLEYPIGKVLYEAPQWISSIRFSPDGTKLAFVDQPLTGDNRGRIGVVDLSGKVTMLTEVLNAVQGLAWSPSGKEIWFSGGINGDIQMVFAVDLSGRRRMVSGAPASLLLEDISPKGDVLLTRLDARRGMAGLAPGAKEERDLTWLDWTRPGDLSADGQWVLFEEQAQGGGPNYSVYLRRTDGSPAVKLGEGKSAALSPDGKWAVTVPLSKPESLVILPIGPGGPRTIETGKAFRSAAWFADGKRLMVEGAEAGRRPRLWVLDTTSGSMRPITPEGVDRGGALSPDGVFAAATIDGATMLYPVDGGEPRAVRGMASDARAISWSGDGRSLFVAKPGEIPLAIERVDLTTGLSSPWRKIDPVDRAGLLSIDFLHLSADARSYVYSYRRMLGTLYLAQGLR